MTNGFKAIVVAILFSAPGFAAKIDTTWGLPGVSYEQYRLDSVNCGKLGAKRDIAGTSEFKILEKGFKQQDEDWDRSRLIPTPNGQDPTIEATRNNAIIARNNNFPGQVKKIQNHLLDGVSQCLIAQGYTRFALTEPQLRKLRALRKGTEARFRYMHALAADAAVISAQVITLYDR